jgi:hypothetical protein
MRADRDESTTDVPSWDGESGLRKESHELNGHAIEYARPIPLK